MYNKITKNDLIELLKKENYKLPIELGFIDIKLYKYKVETFPIKDYSKEINHSYDYKYNNELIDIYRKLVTSKYSIEIEMCTALRYYHAKLPIMKGKLLFSEEMTGDRLYEDYIVNMHGFDPYEPLVDIITGFNYDIRKIIKYIVKINNSVKELESSPKIYFNLVTEPVTLYNLVYLYNKLISDKQR